MDKRYLKPMRINGFVYNLVKSGRNASIFSQTDPEGGRVVSYEVWTVGSTFRPPEDEDFGKVAWTYPTLSKAMEKIG